MRVILDGIGSDALAQSLLDPLVSRSRPAVHVRDTGFLRPAGERFTWGREDLLGRGLPAELTAHLTCSPAALLRRGVDAWELPAFAAYDEEVRPGEVCDVLVRAEDPRHPAVRFR